MRLSAKLLHTGMVIRVREDCDSSNRFFIGEPGTVHVVHKRDEDYGGGFYIQNSPRLMWGLYERYVDDFDVIANADAALLLT